MRGFIAIAVGLLGCSELDTSGELGRINFEISPRHGSDVGDSCFISCPVDRSFLVGTTETISMSKADVDALMPLLSADSSDTDVLTVEGRPYTCCNSSCQDGDHYDACLAKGGEARYGMSATITAVGEGTAHMRVRKVTDGTLYDRLPIRVSRAHRLELQVEGRYSGAEFSTADELRLGGLHKKVRVFALDSDGDWMYASEGGITMQLSDNGVALFDGESPTLLTWRGEVWLFARGNDMLTTFAVGATTQFPVVSE